jgi:hypothetical protein
MEKAQSGLNARLREAELGTLIVGDGIAALADNSWFRIDNVAASGSALPIGKVGYFFKTPDTGNAITPVVDDNVFPVTFETICKVTAEWASEKGVIDITDDCSDGYIQEILDGFTKITGSFSQFLKFEADTSTKKTLNSTQLAILARFLDIVEDDGAGNYTFIPKNDNDFLLFISLNKSGTIGDTVNEVIVPTILSNTTSSLENKAGMNLDVTWSKGEGPAQYYQRVLNVAQVL